MSTLLPAGIALALLVISMMAIANVLLFPRLGARPYPLPPDPPFVSVLIPARNEARVIGKSVASLLAQDYPRFELLVLDDQSEDGTADAARVAGAGDARLNILQGAALPDGWVGKNRACWQLARAAQGEILLFADADVQWQPGALAAVVAAMHAHSADMLTVWPTQTTVTWGERLVVPLMALAILAYLPVVAVHHTPWPIFAAANGQCLAFRRAAYAATGGHAAVAGNIVEDMALARRAKGRGLRLRMFDAAGRIGCRMYHSWPEVRDGYAKNILAGHANSVPFLLLSTLFHWLVYVFPWLWLPFDVRVWPLAAGGVLVRMLTAAATRQRVRDGLLMPVSVVLMTYIAFRAIMWHYLGGPRWKGRVVNCEA
jgi:chlorobactene glucosyltransferase